MTNLRIALFAAASLLAAAPASAQGFLCSVDPASYLGLSSDGMVAVNVANATRTISICSVSQTVGGVNPEACAGWYSSLLTWRALGKSGTIYFNTAHSANQGNTSCSQFPTPDWSVRIPYHIGGA